jgi:hypothetical protein
MKYLAAGCLVLTLALCVSAAPEPPSTELVRRLGDSNYAVREEAAAQLARLGRPAVAALELGVKSRDLAVRRRCAELLAAARRSDFDIVLDDFIAGKNPKDPLPGWTRFRELAGDDVYARRLYVDLYRADRTLLEQLGKDPKQFATKASARFQNLVQRMSMPRPAGDDGMQPEEFAGLLLGLAAAPPADAQQFYQLHNLCYQFPLQSLVRGSPAARRLVGRALATRLKDDDLLMNIVNLAVFLGLSEFIQEKVMPVARTHIEKAKPEDQWRFSQAVHLANQLEMYDLLEGRLKPAVREQAVALARNPDDQNRLFTVLNLVQTLGMEDTVHAVLRPAAVNYFKSIAANPNDIGRIYSARYLAQTLGLDEAFDAVVKPAACRLAVQAALHPEDNNKFHQAIHMAQYLNLDAAFEGALRPAGRRRILADLEQGPAEPNRLVNAAQLAQQLRLQDVAEDTLKPLARRFAKDLVGKPPDAQHITQVHNLAQSLGLADLTENAVKPALRKLLTASNDGTPQEASFNQILQLTRTLQMKEGVPLAVRGALNKSFNTSTRSVAMFFIAEFGAKTDVARLEPLLKETAKVGSCGINSITIHAELRDVALAALIFASGQSLADYGFPYFRIVVGIKPSDTSPGCMGFANAADRDAAQKKWREWQAGKKRT